MAGHKSYPDGVTWIGPRDAAAAAAAQYLHFLSDLTGQGFDVLLFRFTNTFVAVGTLIHLKM